MVLRGTGVRRYDLLGCSLLGTHPLPLFERSIARFNSPSAFEIIALRIRCSRYPSHLAPRIRHACSTCSDSVSNIAQEEFKQEEFNLMDHRLEPLCKGPRVKRLVTRLPREALPDGQRRVLWNAITMSTISR